MSAHPTTNGHHTTNGSAAPAGSLAAFRAFLEAERPAIVATLMQEERARIPMFFQAIPAEEHQRTTNEIVGAYIAGVEDIEQLVAWAKQFLRPHHEQADLGTILKIVALYRQQFLHASLRAIEAGVEGAAKGLSVLMEAMSLTDQVSMQTFQDRMRMFEALVENALDGITVTDMMGRRIYANPANARAYGYQHPSEMAGVDATRYLPPEELVRMQNEIRPQVMREGSWQGQMWGLRGDGSRYRAQCAIVQLRDAEGEAFAFAGFMRDITAEHEAVQALKRQADKLRTASSRLEQSFASTPLATVEWEASGAITRWNPSAERIFGWTAEEAIGKNAVSLVAPFIDEKDLPGVIDAHLRGEIVNGRFQNIAKGGREITCQWYNALLRDDAGQVIGVLAQAEDISDQLRGEQERIALQGQVIQAQQAALRELSTPLIPLADGIVAMPLVGTVDSGRAQQVIEGLLQGVAENRATTAIIDITGVPVVDTQVAGALLRAAQAVELLGARVILTGIRPEVAQTLVGIGVNLGNIITRSTLQDGISFALKGR